MAAAAKVPTNGSLISPVAYANATLAASQASFTAPAHRALLISLRYSQRFGNLLHHDWRSCLPYTSCS